MSAPLTPAEWVRRLGLAPHPEGGFLRETYRARESMPASHLPARYAGNRSLATAILFLLPSAEFSTFHRLKSDELRCFHAGSPLAVHVIDERGLHTEVHLGPDPAAGQTYQEVIPSGRWFAAEVVAPASFALVSCVVAPGFDYADFELARRADPLQLFPQHGALVRRLTRSP